MKGIILAGGSGSRLAPLTKVTNKHLLPVYNKPMIYYPLETLVKAGIKDILIISGKGHAGHFVELLNSGRDFGVRIMYELQEKAGGIAEALALAEFFMVDDDQMAVILGDNIFGDDIGQAVKDFSKQKKGAKIFLKEVPDPNRFGVAELDGKKIKSIEEKPVDPKSNYAVTGLYMYDKNVFDYIRNLKPSDRGELEITDVNNEYIKKGEMTYGVLDGAWTDAGTFQSLYRATRMVAERILKEDLEQRKLQKEEIEKLKHQKGR